MPRRAIPGAGSSSYEKPKVIRPLTRSLASSADAIVQTPHLPIQTPRPSDTILQPDPSLIVPSIVLLKLNRAPHRHLALNNKRHFFNLDSLEDNESNGKVPEWLSNTCGDLPPKHPLRANATPSHNSVPTQDDDNNPFAFQPPSPPSKGPFDETMTAVVSRPHIHAPRPRIPIRRMKLSSVAPRAPPIFTEPTYQEDYHDVSMPLNDFVEPPSPPYFAGNPQLPSPNLSPIFNPPPLTAHYPTPSPLPSSPLFISDVRPTSQQLPQLSPVPSAFLFSSDDTTVSTPPHNITHFSETNQIDNAPRNHHMFISSVYATSLPLAGLPLNLLVGGYTTSPQAQTSSPLPGPSRPAWVSLNNADRNYTECSLSQNNSPKLDTHTSSVRPRPDSADVYKSRLLAYATAAADQLSSCGRDEILAHQRWGRMEPSASNTPRRPDSAEAYDETALDPSHGELFYAPPAEDMGEEMSQEIPQPQDANLPPVNQLLDEPHTLTPIAEASSEANDEDLPDSENFNQIDVELFEDWRDEPEEDDLEGNGALNLGNDLTQTEEDELAADDEAGEVLTPLPEDRIATLVEAKAEPNTAATPKRNPSIAPFPVSVSRRASSDRNEFSANSETMAKLSPKFVARPARRVRPSPFAHLLKNRREPAPNVEGTVGQGTEDEIESWPV
ncbi:hypothetical protein FRC07_000387 [Ceratobasidium sp. 392]|nr:hypothetical protein FRC07_000387 [Ceratobasidium sp. 392]